jgi:hypothetical protein
MATEHIQWKFLVSFEYDTEPSQTLRGKITVPNIQLGARRAVEAARAKYKSAKPRSVVVVLERPEGKTIKK